MLTCCDKTPLYALAYPSDNYYILFRICCACKIGQVSVAYDIYSHNTFNYEENRYSLCYYLNFAELNQHITLGKTSAAKR